MAKPTLHALESRLDALGAKLDATRGDKRVRGVFVREGETVEEAARKAGVRPGEACRPMRWMTEEEWKAKEAEQQILIDGDKGDA